MTTSRISVKPALQFVALAALLLAIAIPAHAAGSNMPWEAPLQSVLDSIQGPVARIIAVIIIIATGLDAGLRRHQRRLPQAGADRVRSVDRVRRIVVLPDLLQLQRRSGAGMNTSSTDTAVRLRGAAAPLADRTHPAGWRAAHRGDCQRHAGRRRGARAATLAARHGAVDRRALAGRVGRATGCAVHGGLRAAHQAPATSGRVRAIP